MVDSEVPNAPGAYQLISNNQIIYVGSATDLRRRYDDWRTNPENPCVKRSGWQTFRFQVTRTHQEALSLELDWYIKFNPVCNLKSPPVS